MLLFLLGCPGTPDDTGKTPADCADYVGAASALELAPSPRADAAAEELALCLDGGLVAGEASYVRAAADLDVAEGLVPSTGYGARYGDVSVHALVVCPQDGDTWDAMVAGTYDGWTCANALYRASVEDLYSSISCAELTFEPRLDPRLLVDEYAAMPGMGYAEPGSVDGDGPVWRGVIEGEAVHYVYDARNGDCPSGCTFGTAYHLVSEAPGEVTLLESWDWGDTGGAGEPEPAWYDTYNRCAD